MDIFDIAQLHLILTILAVMLWMTGVLIIAFEFFREYRGTFYDSGSHETEKYVQWKKRRSAQYKKGTIIMIVGFSLHALLIVIPYILGAFFAAL